jgi:anthranilate phosphoribosyltransferase
LPHAKSLLISAIDPADSADKIRRVLDGQDGAARDIVILNAAAALWVAGLTDSPAHGAERCAAAIDNGQAKEILGELVWMTNKK